MRSFIVLLTAFCVCSFSVDAQDWARFDRYAAANAQVTDSPKAVLMGDSITDGWASTDPEFFTANNFVGRGISGQTTSHMLVRFRKDVIDLKPEYVLILAGTNDIAKNNGDITLENILGNIISMCEIAKVNGITPVICSVLPADRYGWRPSMAPAEDIIALNQMLRNYADSQNIIYIDYHSKLKNENNGLPVEYAADGVHPNLTCYKIMEQMILDVL